MICFSARAPATFAALAALCAALVFSAGALAGGRSEFDRYLKENELVLPNAVDYRAFDDACAARGLLHSDNFLKDEGIKIHGSGDGRYLLRADLLRACGKECNPREGLGELLTDLAEFNISNR